MYNAQSHESHRNLAHTVNVEAPSGEGSGEQASSPLGGEPAVRGFVQDDDRERHG